MERKVQLTAEIFSQLEAVREKCDLFDVGCVVGELAALGHTKAVFWITGNPHTYSRWLSAGSIIGDVLDTDSGDEIEESIIDKLDNHFAQDAEWKHEQDRYNCPQCGAAHVSAKAIESEEISEPVDDIDMDEVHVYHARTRYECVCPVCDYVWYEDESDDFVA